MLDFLYTIFVRIPLIILAMIFIVVFIALTIIMLMVGLTIDVFLYATGLGENVPSENSRRGYESHRF